MSGTTGIEWATHVWNPIRGCSRVSPGCEHCYAERYAAIRHSGKGRAYEGLAELTDKGPRWTGRVVTVPDALEEPLHWRKPRRIFVNSMSDLFHEGVPDETIFRVFATMAAASHHRFIVLTKRAKRMREWCAEWCATPLPNVALGVSVESDPYALERLPELMATPAAVKLVSVEPMLGPVSLNPWLRTYIRFGVEAMGCQRSLDWVIVGGESGPGARPCDIAWIESLVRECRGGMEPVPVFVKQIGSRPVERDIVGGAADATACVDRMKTYRVDRLAVAAGGAAAIECRHGYDACPKCDAGTMPVRDPRGGNPIEWPAALQVRQIPDAMRVSVRDRATGETVLA